MAKSAYISTIPERDAASLPQLPGAYALFRSEIPISRRVAVPQFFQALSLRPAYLRAATRLFKCFWWDGPLRRSWREALAVTVSVANTCFY